MDTNLFILELIKKCSYIFDWLKDRLFVFIYIEHHKWGVPYKCSHLYNIYVSIRIMYLNDFSTQILAIGSSKNIRYRGMLMLS